MEPDAPVTRRRPLLHGWRGLLILAGLGLAGIVVAIGVWFTSDGDLRRIEREMASAGLPTTWKALGVQRTDAERLRIYERLAALAKMVKPWKPKTGDSTLSPGIPFPPELKTWHDQLAGAELNELLRLIDGLPAERPFLIDDFSLSRRAPWMSAWNDLARLYCQRVVLAADLEVSKEARRLLHLLNIVPRLPTYLGLMGDQSHLLTAIKHLALRLPLLRGDVGVADAIDSIIRNVEARREQNDVGALLSFVDECRGMQRDPSFVGGTFSHTNVNYLLARERGLRKQLAWILQSQAYQPGFERFALAKRLSSTPPPPTLFGLNQSIGLDPAFFEQPALKARWAALVLAAEIRGGPWPVDPCDSTGATLRRLKRDGQLIGAYSVGRNETDDHGERGDEAFALYGPLKAPATVSVRPETATAAPSCAPSSATP